MSITWLREVDDILGTHRVLAPNGTSVACPTSLVHRQSGTPRTVAQVPTTRRAPSVRPGPLPDLSGADRSLAPERDDAANQDED
jgi:hypothetical protein